MACRCSELRVDQTSGARLTRLGALGLLLLELLDDELGVLLPDVLFLELLFWVPEDLPEVDWLA